MTLPPIGEQPGTLDLVRRALEEDLGRGDVTSAALVPAEARASAAVLARGRCVVDVCGVGRSRQELERIGTELAQSISQRFIYNKVVSELKSKNFNFVSEEVDADGTIRIQVRNWQS